MQMIRFTVDGVLHLQCSECIDWPYVDGLNRVGRTSIQILANKPGLEPRHRTRCESCGVTKLVRPV